MMDVRFTRHRSLIFTGCTVLLAVAVMAMPRLAGAQVSVYAEGTVSDLQQGPGGNYLYGGTVGMLYDGPKLLKKAYLSGDIQARYVAKNGERLVGAAIGPRFSLPVRKLRLTPYAEFLIGFARYRDSDQPGAYNTTDNQFQINAGAVRRLSARLDLMFDYDYSQYGTENGKYNPKNFNIGVVFHFVRQ